MTSGVRLSSMRVDAFRGISDPIDFDLSSPITLVFAPNGTGKTTLCEAAEWLLSGQVERLRDRKDFDPAVLKSKFTDDDRNPIVDASIIVAGKERRLIRTAVGSHQEARMSEGGAESQAIGPHELLSFLAPAVAAQEAHHLRAINLRQRWLRGTRFLSAEALAALVDSDDETIERRTQVFADLLGIRHLLDAEKLCDRFIADLGSRERNLSQAIAGQEAEIANLAAALAAQADRGFGTTSAAAEVAAAGTKLGVAIDELDRGPGALADRIETLNVEHGRREHRLKGRIN
jgi:exonuclease SbcC